MAKRNLGKPEKRVLAEKILDLGNLAAGVLVFSQVTFDSGYNIALSFTGVFILIFTYFWIIIYLRRS